MRLRDIPRGSIIKLEDDSGQKIDVTFHRIDGMYSYCTSADGTTFHLHNATPLVKVDDHYEIEE